MVLQILRRMPQLEQFLEFISPKNPNETILQSGDNLLASGFLFMDQGKVDIFSWKRNFNFSIKSTDEFVLMQEAIKIPEYKRIIYQFFKLCFWPSYIKSYVEECISLYKFNNQSNYNMRWIGSLVADCYRILIEEAYFYIHKIQEKVMKEETKISL